MRANRVLDQLRARSDQMVRSSSHFSSGGRVLEWCVAGALEKCDERVEPVEAQDRSGPVLGRELTVHPVGGCGPARVEIAEVIGAGLRLPVESITQEEAPGYYGWLAQLATLDLPASGALTRQQLNWVPTGPGLLTDLRETDYDAT
ncbi:MAG TPA: hypothetical protein VGG54_25040 [Trebonia sp.]